MVPGDYCAVCTVCVGYQINAKNSPGQVCSVRAVLVLSSINGHIDLEAHDLAQGVLREFLCANLEVHDLLKGNGVFIVFIDIGLQMCLDIGDAVLFDIVLVGIDLGDDGIVHDAALGLTFIDDDIENAGG